MLTNEKSFFITLTSNSSIELYPENTLSRFTTKLPYILELSEEWYVGITKFACTAVNIKDDTLSHTSQPPLSKLTFFNLRGEIGVEIIDIVKLFPDFFHYINNQSFFDHFSTDLDLTRPDLSILKENFVQVLMNGRILVLKFKYEYTPLELFESLFSQIPKENWSTEISKLKISIDEKQSTKPATEKKIKTRVKERAYNIAGQELIRGIPNFMCFYSDLIQPRIFGNVMARGMLMHPVRYNKQYADYQNCDIVNVEYLRLEKNRISEINILIADETGEQIKFKNDSFSTMIVMHFCKSI